MTRRIAIIQGHPDATRLHFGHHLMSAYARGAAGAGHETRLVEVAKLVFPLLSSKQDWERGETPPDIAAAQQDIAWADHLVICYPLWLGSMPAILKGFFEQVARPGFAFTPPGSNQMWKKLLKGKSARIVVTMGMPATIYRWYFGAHSLKSLERNILGFVGIAPIRASIIGMVEHPDVRKREDWLRKLEALGRKGD